MDGAVWPKFHHAFPECKEGVVRPTAHKESWFKTCPSLPDDDLARPDPFSPECLDAETLRVRFAAVLCASLSFYVSHV